MRILKPFFVFVVLTVSLPLRAQEESSAYTNLKARLVEQCRASKMQVVFGDTQLQKEQAAHTMILACECAPAEIERRVEARPEIKLVDQEGLPPLIKSVVRSCSAKQFRENISRLCLVGAKEKGDVDNLQAHCACVNEKANALSDDEIADDADRANREFRAKVDARAKGLPDPVHTPSVMDPILAACKASTR